MAYKFLEMASTPSVQAVQAQQGADKLWRNEGIDRQFDRFGPNEAAFIAARDSFYMATVSESGWPYVQHRGGPAGFLKLLDDRTLAFADYRGNRQYISVGNLAADDRAALILVDYARQARLKMFVHTEAVALDAEPELTDAVLDQGYRARPERILRLEAFDWNCPQHITPRFRQDEVIAATQMLRERLNQLEAENAALRAQLAAAAS